ncbi:MAG: hypothetical protein AAF196_16470 [Planctomycetota bacterium]
MDFEAPQRLLALLVLPLLWLLSLRPKPRRSFQTAHWNVWQRALRVQTRPPRPRLRFLLLALAFLAVSLASAGTTIGRREGPSRLIVLVDRSASTGRVASPGNDAMQVLRNRLRDELRDWSGETNLRLVLCGEGVEVEETKLDLAFEQPAFTTLLQGCEVDLEALAKAGSADSSAAIVVVGDEQTSVPPSAASLRFRSSQTIRRGILSARCEDDWPLSTIRVRLDLFDERIGTNAEEPLTLAVQGAPRQIGVEAFPIEGDLERGVELTFERGSGGRLRLTLNGEDGFEADDWVEFVVPAPPRRRVVALGDSEAIEDAAGFVRDLFGLEASEGSVAASGAAVVLADGGRFDSWTPGMLSFGVHTAADTRSVEDGEAFLVDWDREHPLLQGLDLSEMRVRRRLPRDFAPDGAQVLLRGRDGPLLVSWEDDGGRSLHAAFRLEDSNLWRLPAFPRLLRRAVRWLILGQAAPLEPSATGLLNRSESLGFPERRISPVSQEDPTELLAAGFPLLPADPGRSLAAPLVVLAILLLGLRSLWP